MTRQLTTRVDLDYPLKAYYKFITYYYDYKMMIISLLGTHRKSQYSSVAIGGHHRQVGDTT